MLANTYYTLEEAARILKLHPQTLRRWIRQGRLPARRFGRQFRLRLEDLEEAAQPALAEEAEESEKIDRAAVASPAELSEDEEDGIEELLFERVGPLAEHEREWLLDWIDEWVIKRAAFQPLETDLALEAVQSTWASISLESEILRWVAEDKELEYDLS